MKKIICFLLTSAVSFSMVACNSNEINVKAEYVTENIINNFEDNLNMEKVSEENVKLYYNIDLDKIDDYSIYIEGSGGFADEVAVFKVKDSEYKNNVKDAINARIAQRKKDFTNYNTEELAKIDDYSIEEKGNYIALIIAENSLQAEKAFNNTVK